MEDAPPACEAACCAEPGGKGKVRQMLEYGFVELPRDIGRSLLAGLAVAALITALVPQNFFGDALGGFFAGGVGAMLVMMVMGIPVYVCASASVPFAAALVAKGLSPGAALVFLMTGPATNAATIAMIWKVMGRRTAGLYLLAVAASGLASGLVLDYLFHFSFAVAPITQIHEQVRPYEWLSAIAMLAVLAYAILHPLAKRTLTTVREAEHVHSGDGDQQPARAVLLRIEGMSCDHCVRAVREALLAVAGVQAVQVYLGRREARVEGRFAEPDLRAAVETAGYQVARIDEVSVMPPPEPQT